MKTFKQVLFNHILSEMKKQNWGKAQTVGGSCVYLADDGLRCAVGVCLPRSLDHIWKYAFGTVYTLHHAHSDHLPTFIAGNIDFLSHMQKWHDGYNLNRSFLSDIAKDWNLTIPEDLMPPVSTY